MCKLHRLVARRRGQVISKWDTGVTGRYSQDLQEICKKQIGNGFAATQSEVHYDVQEEHVQDTAWMLQISHFFSKALMYNAFGVKVMPLNDCFSEGIDYDPYALRKTPIDPCWTPSHDGTPIGKILKPQECFPTNIQEF